MGPGHAHPWLSSYETASAFLRQNEIGRRASIDTPFGRRLLSYADLTATGRYLHFIEAWIRRVRPFYANTHTAVSSTGRVMTELREDARRVVARAVGADDSDEVIFVGSGATSAINKLIGLLGLRVSRTLDERYGWSRSIPERERPVVLLGPYEHHSNELPWLESFADVIEVDLDARGGIDMGDLEAKLASVKDRELKIGSFSAASNVTGVLTDVAAVSRVLHRHGALAFFDYAAAGPYVPIDMHPPDPEARLDGIFLSMHKFLGGPQASGVLVLSRSAVRLDVPERPGGGTVDYVAGATRDAVDYVSSLSEREEGGTPAIVGDIRAGIVFLVKDMLGAERIREHEVRLARRAIERLSRHPQIDILGPVEAERLGIVSFNIVGVHHDLASALLDHLFGIQNRAGCSCAGPYGHRLLGIDRATSERYRKLIARGIGGIKPGWVRISIPYYASESDIEFLLSAVEFVADHARDFLACYALSWKDGVWRHTEQPVPDVPPIELTIEDLMDAAMSFAAGDHETPMSERDIEAARKRYFEEAERAARQACAHLAREGSAAIRRTTGEPLIDELVWFDFVHTDAPPAL